jgi:hypothetical protein
MIIFSTKLLQIHIFKLLQSEAMDNCLHVIFLHPTTLEDFCMDYKFHELQNPLEAAFAVSDNKTKE